MKSYRLKPQERDTYCLCSTLQAIFDRHGIVISQDEIAQNLTPAENGGFITNDRRIKRFMKSRGFSYEFYWHDTAPFNERDTLLEEIHEKDGIIGINSHIYLLADFDYSDVKMIDPTHGEVIERSFLDITRQMGINNGFFGLVRRMS